MTYNEFKRRTLCSFDGFIDNAKYEIDTILMHFSGMKRNELLLNRAKNIPDDIFAKLSDAVNRRLSGEPIQYIIGEWEFFGLRMFCGKGCLIPRPETEMLAEYAIKLLPRGGKLLDLCTGSGCIPVAILNNRPDVSAVAVDISAQALEYAERNAEYHAIGSDRLKFVNADIYEYEPDFLPDLIISNPPYIKSCDIETLSKEVQYEPALALDGGHDGLDFYKLIAKFFCKKHLNENGCCAVEVGHDIGQEVAAIFRSLKFETILLKDNFGVDRVCLAKRPSKFI